MREFFSLIEKIENREHYLRGLCNRIKGDRILDIATGSGYLIRNLLDLPVAIFCTDIRASAMKKLKSELKDTKARLYFVCCDATRLPFKSKVFSSAISWSAIAHIQDWQALLREMDRVAEKILLAEPLGEYSLRAFREFALSHEVPEPEEVADFIGAEIERKEFFYLVEKL